MTPICEECGALMGDEQKHLDWHKTIVRSELAPGEPAPEPEPIPEVEPDLEPDIPEEN